MKMNVYQVKLTTHDFLFFVTRELRVGVVEKYINNTALLYAINIFSPVHRVVSGTRPYYEEDWSKFSIYATPAKLLHDRETVKISYNSVDEDIAFKMEEERKRAFPKYGAYQMFPPDTQFFFYTIGGKGPETIRLGKKSCICRLKYEKLKVESIKRGEFTCSHPINPRHMPTDFTIKEGTLIPTPPIPLFDNVTARGEHIIAEDGGRKHYIAIPDKTLFNGVFYGNR
ncbi:MAG: type I-D CRISPR-associated protein Cas5/Csc1 [Candidatus Freyarchaeota archaeon]